MKVMLAGEGADDLGEWAKETPYRSARHPEVGIIEALLRKIATTPFAVSSALLWKKITKYRSGNHLQPETRTVLGVTLHAEEAGCDVVVFVRDRDGYEDRQADVETGIRKAREQFPISVVGGVAIEEIEAWILALKGARHSEHHTDAKNVLYQKHQISSRAAMAEVIENANFDTIAEDAKSFHQWLRDATCTFTIQS